MPYSYKGETQPEKKNPAKSDQLFVSLPRRMSMPVGIVNVVEKPGLLIKWLMCALI